MTASAFSGPLIVNTSNPLGPYGTGSANQNPEAGASLFAHGTGLLDPRSPYTYYQGAAATSKVYGWYSNPCQVINQVPSTLAVANIAASQTPAAAALTLVSSTAAGITVLSTTTYFTSATTGLQVTSGVAIDGVMAGTSFSQDGTFNLWDPTKAIARNLRITSGGNDSGITFLVVGYDVYGYPMSEAITGANAGVASGVKAFKYVTSITPSGAVATTCSAGTGDVIGLPLRADYVGQCQINYNSAWVTASTGFVAAVTTSPATTTTGDVRGTYALQSASDNSKRLIVVITPLAGSIGTVTGLLGVAQNLSATNN